MSGMVWIIIVNYRTPDLALDCVRSVLQQTTRFSRLHVGLVDNSSGDGSVDKLERAIDREGWGDRVSLLPMSRNGGFAFGCNAGIRAALDHPEHVKYVMLLNPDTKMHQGSLEALCNFMEARPNVGIAGCLIENAEGELECSAHNAFSPLGELESGARLALLSRILHRHVVTPDRREAAHECEWVSGASMIIRRAVFSEIGLMDEGYFLYFEEADFCARTRKAGWQIWFVPESRIAHFEGASTGIRDVVRRRPKYWYDSRRRYFIKHYGLLGWIAADLLWGIARASLVLRRAMGLGRGGDRLDPKLFATDLLWGDFNALVSGGALKVAREIER